MKIHVLSQHIANQIAAGEVIERPASVVKELLENAIDANATSITIETRGGGVEYIRVRDNGDGIASSDAETAFLPHATSKISSAEDLFHIDTLGFRGEALASIAAVSRITLQTRTADEEIGTRLVVEAGKVLHKTQVASQEGTSIEVENLFFNMPARLKFLKAPRSEASYISDLVSRLIMANTGISFKLVQNGRQVYVSAGDGMLDHALFAVYGSDVLEHMRPVHYDDGYLLISGAIGTEKIARANRMQQTFLVNKRYIKSQKLSFALSRAYDTRLMSGLFPFAVIHITMSSSDMDINVHPNKLDIRFKDEERVMRALTIAARNALGPSLAPQMKADAHEPISNIGHAPEKLNLGRTPAFFGSQIPTKGLKVNEASFSIAPPVINARGGAPAPFRMETQMKPQVQSAPGKNESRGEQVVFGGGHYRVIGQIFECYWIVQQESTVFFIDQHAAHERKLYEEYVNRDVKPSSQMLLVPAVVKLTPLEFDTLMDNIEQFASLGFDIEEFGTLTVSVRAVPHVIGQPQTMRFLHDALGMLSNKKKLATVELKRSAIIQSACKHAIKQGEALPRELIEELLSKVKNEGIPLTCPHGRPIMVQMSRAEFEKQFKRVL